MFCRSLIEPLKCNLSALRKFFCSAEQSKPTANKSYRMPVKKDEQLYRSTYPIRFHNYRVLLYANKQNVMTPALLQTHIAFPFFLTIYLIKYNPWYLTFPASLPIMIGVQFYLLMRWIFNKRHYKYIVQRVYLYESNMIEFVFSNKLRRKFKNIQDFHRFHDPLELITPSQGTKDNIEWLPKGTPFPSELIYVKNEKTGEIECLPSHTPVFYGWTKYCSNYQNYIFPRNYEYANWQILVQLLNGRNIYLLDRESTIHEMQSDLQYPSLEQETKWISEDNKKNMDLRSKRSLQNNTEGQKALK